MMDKSIRILAVGNSFSDDAFHYLHDLAAADGVDITAVNLYIGGCNLKTHYQNLCSDEKAYARMENGVFTGRYVSIRETLEEGSWDYIMTQQASHDSGILDTYFPYLQYLVNCFRRLCPEAAVLLHETWAYERDSDHSAFPRYNRSQEEMYRKLRSCYRTGAKRCLLPLIPSGDVIQEARKRSPFRYELGERSLCRDGYHMDLVYGRYLVAAVVYFFLTKNDLGKNTFLPPEGEQAIVDVLKDWVMETMQPPHLR